jgi:hypothetical protein
MTDISFNNNMKIITQESCSKIRQIIEELEKKIEKNYCITSVSRIDNVTDNSIAAGRSGSTIDNSYHNWVGSLRR